jgi:hypothetical protein
MSDSTKPSEETKVAEGAESVIQKVEGEGDKVVVAVEKVVKAVVDEGKAVVEDIGKMVPKGKPAAATATEQPTPASSVKKVTAEPAATVPVSATSQPATIIPPTAKEVADSRALSVVKELLGEYERIMSATVQTTKSAEAAANNLCGVLIRALDSHTPELLDTVWEFFVKHAEGILVENRALIGFESLAVGIRQRVELAYTLFRKAVKGIDITNAKVINQSTLKNSVKSPGLINYLANKVKSII